jgi:hypothetical protein
MSPKENPFSKDRPDVEVTKLKSSEVEVLNAVTALLREQRRFDRETVTKFKKLFGDRDLSWWIIFAGVGGLVELIRLIADAWTHFH